jgi:hypothetical protein
VSDEAAERRKLLYTQLLRRTIANITELALEPEYAGMSLVDFQLACYWVFCEAAGVMDQGLMNLANEDMEKMRKALDEDLQTFLEKGRQYKIRADAKDALRRDGKLVDIKPRDRGPSS